MPLYDYSCPSCGSEKEVRHSMNEIGKIAVECDSCGAKMKKMLSTPTLIGFDEVGRSISKKDKAENSKRGGTKDTKSTQATQAATKKDAA